jgi:hypothetical protein
MRKLKTVISSTSSSTGTSTGTTTKYKSTAGSTVLVPVLPVRCSRLYRGFSTSTTTTTGSTTTVVVPEPVLLPFNHSTVSFPVAALAGGPSHGLSPELALAASDFYYSSYFLGVQSTKIEF